MKPGILQASILTVVVALVSVAFAGPTIATPETQILLASPSEVSIDDVKHEVSEDGIHLFLISQNVECDAVYCAGCFVLVTALCLALGGTPTGNECVEENGTCTCKVSCITPQVLDQVLRPRPAGVTPLMAAAADLT